MSVKLEDVPKVYSVVDKQGRQVMLTWTTPAEVCRALSLNFDGEHPYHIVELTATRFVDEVEVVQKESGDE